MMDRTEKDPLFRTLMFVIIGVLVLSYIGYKSWHIRLAVQAYDGQVLENSTKGAAK